VHELLLLLLLSLVVAVGVEVVEEGGCFWWVAQ
jgi:hypothetical protein